MLGSKGEGWVGLQLVLFAAIGLAGLLAIQGRTLVLGAAEAVGIVLVVLGLALVARSAWDLGRSLSPFPKPLANNQLVQTGAFRWVRHPIYIGIVVAGLGWSLATGAWLAAVLCLLLLALFDAKSRREEAWLSEVHAEYAAYAARTRRFIPGVY